MLTPLPSRLSSTVQVEITFENPVVFAGQSVNAIITFRNPNEPPVAPLETTNAGSHKEDSEQQGQLDANGVNLFLNTPTRTRFSRAMSATSTAPHLDTHSSITKDQPNHSPLSQSIPPLSISSPSGSSIISDTSSPSVSPVSVLKPLDTSFLSDDDSSRPSTPTTQPSWESRLSSHLASSFRDLYRDTNNSTPEVNDNGHIPRPANNSLSPIDTPLYGSATTSRWSSRIGRPMQHQLTRSGSTYIQSQKSANLTHGLLMGYVQLQGYYVLDENLINTEEFAHVKTQGVVVSPNGSIDYKSQSSGGLLQGLASGLGSLLQIRDSDSNSSSEGLARRVSFGRKSKRSPYSGSRLAANGKNDAIPIFSTPQSLLFVDLKLSPGESKSFSYKLELPMSLPPSCRAKSIRIHYNLVVGIQKLDSRGRPQPKTTLVPFRVFPHVDKYGQQYTHDLQTPIVLQKDQASVVQLPSDRYLSPEKVFGKAVSTNPDSIEDDRASFVSHIEGLFSADLNVRNQLLSQQIDLQAAPKNNKVTPQDNIDFFCRYHHTFDNVKPMRSRFDIGRSGRRIATVILSKPVYRVGENIVFVVEYINADLKCFHITASLETEESISQDALRKREDHVDVTRRVYSQSTMSTYSLNKSTFEFAIPATATPQFSTSSIALKWNLKLDFITSPTDSNEATNAAATSSNNRRTVSDDHEAVNASVSKPSLTTDNHNSRRNGSTSASISSRRVSHYRHRSTSSLSTIATTAPASMRHIEFQDDPRSAIHVLHFNDQGLIAGTKETIACESFHCKIPIMVLPTNQDISALLEHTVSATRVLSM